MQWRKVEEPLAADVHDSEQEEHKRGVEQKPLEPLLSLHRRQQVLTLPQQPRVLVVPLADLGEGLAGLVHDRHGGLSVIELARQELAGPLQGRSEALRGLELRLPRRGLRGGHGAMPASQKLLALLPRRPAFQLDARPAQDLPRPDPVLLQAPGVTRRLLAQLREDLLPRGLLGDRLHLPQKCPAPRQLRRHAVRRPLHGMKVLNDILVSVQGAQLGLHLSLDAAEILAQARELLNELALLFRHCQRRRHGPGAGSLSPSCSPLIVPLLLDLQKKKFGAGNGLAIAIDRDRPIQVCA